MAQKQPEQIQTYLDIIFIARNIERIGDHATNIAEDAVYVKAARRAAFFRRGHILRGGAGVARLATKGPRRAANRSGLGKHSWFPLF